MVPAIYLGFALAFLRVLFVIDGKPESVIAWQSFQAVAHLFVGGLFVAWCFQRQDWQKRLFWSLVAVEVLSAAFSFSR